VVLEVLENGGDAREEIQGNSDSLGLVAAFQSVDELGGERLVIPEGNVEG